jgi:hypothetical protein
VHLRFWRRSKTPPDHAAAMEALRAAEKQMDSMKMRRTETVSDSRNDLGNAVDLSIIPDL